MKIGNKLRKLRTSRNLTQSDIAQLLSVSQASVNRYEWEETEANYEALVSLADYYDISLDYIFGRCDEPQGKVFKGELYEFRSKIEHNAEWCKFVESCFDASSPMGGKVQQELKAMSRGLKRN